MEVADVETVETNMEHEGDEKSRMMGAADEDSLTANDHESNEDSNDTLHETEAQIIPIVTQSGSISYQSTGNQQYSVSVPSQNVTNVKIVKVVPLPHARSEVWSYFGFIADDDGEIQDKKKAICKICASTLAYSGNTTNLFTHLKAMHPEANPQKLAPTNRTPRTGKKLNKRKFYEVSPNVLETSPIPTKTVNLNASTSQTPQQYIIRAITYSGNESTPATLFDSESSSLTQIASNGTMVKSPNVKTVSVVNSGASAGDIPVVSCEDITAALVRMLVRDCRPLEVVRGKGFQELLKLLAPGYRVPEEEKLKTLVEKRYEEMRRDLILRVMEEQ